VLGIRGEWRSPLAKQGRPDTEEAGVKALVYHGPRQAIEDAGAETTLLSIHEGEIQARNHDIEEAGTFTLDGHSNGHS
jgi:hypothetical protein